MSRNLFLKTFFSIVGLVSISATSSPVHAQATLDQIRTELAPLFNDLRLGDLSAEIKRNRERDLSSLTPLQISVSQGNEERYQVINHARELAEIIFVHLENNSGNHDALAPVILLTAKALAMKPYAMPRDLPADLRQLRDDVEKMPSGSTKDEKSNELTAKMQSFYAGIMRQTANDHMEDLVADFANTLYGAEKIAGLRHRLATDYSESHSQADDRVSDRELLENLLSIQNHVKGILTTLYTDLEISQTRYLGRAMAAVVLKFGQKHRLEEIKPALEKECHAQGIDLGNFIGSGFHLKKNDVWLKVRELFNSTIVTERSDGLEADNISSAVWPNIHNFFRAIKRGLIGHIITPFLAVSDDIPSADLSWTQQIKLKLAQWKIFKRGFSHVGTIDIAVDQSSTFPEEATSWLDKPIKITWVDDIYDSTWGGPGGRRQIGIESFAPEGPFVKIGFTDYDPQKIWEMVQQKRAEVLNKGWDSIAWPAFEGITSEEGLMIPDLTKPKPIMKDITGDEFLDQTNPRKTTAQKYYEERYVPAIRRGLHEMLVSDDTAFANNFAAVNGLAYCEQVRDLSTARILGFTTFTYPDKWAPQIRLAKWASQNPIGSRFLSSEIKSALAFLDLDVPVVSPNGALWDPKVKRFDEFDYPKMTEGERLRAGTNTRRFDMNPDVFDNLQAIRGYFAIREGETSAWTQNFAREDLLEVVGFVIDWTDGVRTAHSRILGTSLFRRASPPVFMHGICQKFLELAGHRRSAD